MGISAEVEGSIAKTLDRRGVFLYTVNMIRTVDNHLADSLGSVSKHTLTDQVVDILKRFIVLEGLDPGDRLPSERQLVAALGVSHLVIREALAKLAAEGLIVKEHGRGAFVHKFDRELLQTDLIIPAIPFPAINDLHLVRSAIEIGIMPILAQRITDDVLSHLQDIIHAQAQLVKVRKSVAPEDLRFHRVLLRATQSESLQRFEDVIVECLRSQLFIFPQMLSRRLEDETYIIHEHQAIVEALRRRDSDGATRAMRLHLKEYSPMS